MARSGVCSQSGVGGKSGDPARSALGAAGNRETGYMKGEGTGQIINILSRLRFECERENKHCGIRLELKIE